MRSAGCFTNALTRTVGIMSWRIQVTVQSVTQNDFVWGLGTIGLISHLELWLGLIVACVPTLAPLVNKYIRPTFTKWYSGSKRSGPGQLREAQSTIGGTSKRGLRRNYGVLNEEYLELHRSNNSSEADATATPTLAAEGETWMNDPDAIRVRHEIQVDFAPRRHAA